MNIDIASLRGLDAHRSADAELAARLAELDTEAAGQPFNDTQRAEFEGILESRETLAGVIEELETREKAVAAALGTPKATEAPRYAIPNVGKAADNIFDLAAYRQKVGSVDELASAYRDGAMRVIEAASFPLAADQDKARALMAKLVEKHKDDDYGVASKRIIGTSSPLYVEAWGNYITGKPNSPRHMAALQTYSDSDGGVAIPVVIDPTFINTSDGSVNALRGMARVETITGKSWSPVTTAGVTAAYVGERTTTGASDSAPSDMDDPTATPVRADVSIDVTLEYMDDYGASALLGEIGGLVGNAKDDLESDKFELGTGSAEPEGIIYALDADGSSVVVTGTNDVYALEDIDSLIAALGPRFRGRAEFLAALAIYQISRGFADAGQPAGSIYDQVSKILRGYKANESTAMDAVTTDAKQILLFGDFKTGFVIVDRLGLTTKVMETRDSGGRPTGGTTIYAAWRNTSKLLVPNAFRLLEVD